MAVTSSSFTFISNEGTAKKAKDIDLVIHASVCRDFLEPATSALIHDQLGLSSTCAFFDLSNACLGIMHAWTLAAQLIQSKAYKNVLVVGAENSGPLLCDTLEKLENNTDGHVRQ